MGPRLHDGVDAGYHDADPGPPAVAVEEALRHGTARSETREELGKAVELVVDPVHAAGMPVGRDIDADHRLVEPALGLVGQFSHRQVGTELYDRLDVRP